MQVAQRGTSFTLENNSIKYPVDRFLVHDVNSSAGEATISQSTTAPTDFKNSLKIDVTTADTALVAADQYKIEYRVEGQDIEHLNYGTSAAKTVTLSFYIRSNKTGNTQVALLNAANDRAYVATFTIDSANTFERKELTISGVTDGTWLNTNQTGLRLRWGSFGSTYQTSSTNQWVSGSQFNSRSDSPINFFDSTDNELYITGVQLEVGSQATPFEHRSFGEELALCQRYFEITEGVDSSERSVGGFAVGAGVWYATNQLLAIFPFKQTKRAIPSISVSASDAIKAYTGSASAIAANDSSVCDAIGLHSARFNFTPASVGTAGHGTLIQMQNNKSISVDAEL